MQYSTLGWEWEYAPFVVRRTRKMPVGPIAIAFGVLATIAVLWWTPWSVVHPLDPSLIIATVHAPIWRKPTTPGLRIEIDAPGLVLRLIAIWAAVGVWLGLSSDRWS
jgi:hypothetical protein